MGGVTRDMRQVCRQHGVGLIEVMVTVLILSTSLLALAALQNRSLQFNHEAYLRSQANILAYDIMDRVRANRPNAAQYSKAFDETPAGGALASQDLSAWAGDVARLLPGGEGAIACDVSTMICTVKLRWAEQDAADIGGEDSDANSTTFTYQAGV